MVGNILHWAPRSRRPTSCWHHQRGRHLCQGYPSPTPVPTSVVLVARLSSTATSGSSTGRRSDFCRPARQLDFRVVPHRPRAPKHRGISFLLCPMDQPGIEVRPIQMLSGDHDFNETFFRRSDPQRQCHRWSQRGLGCRHDPARPRARRIGSDPAADVQGVGEAGREGEGDRRQPEPGTARPPRLDLHRG